MNVCVRDGELVADLTSKDIYGYLWQTAAWDFGAKGKNVSFGM